MMWNFVLMPSYTEVYLTAEPLTESPNAPTAYFATRSQRTHELL